MASNPNNNNNVTAHAHTHAGYLAGDDTVQHNSAYFQHNNNNAFAGFDSTLSNTHSLQANDHWNYDPDRLDVGHDHDTSPSLYQGWQSSHNLSGDNLLQNSNAFYSKQYANNQLPFQSTAFVNASNFDQQPSSTLDTVYTNRANVTTSNYDTLNPAFPSSSVPLDTISPGALQQRPLVQRNASSSSQAQPSSTSTPSSAGQQPQKPLPRGTVLGNFVIITPESLARVTNSRRLHNFVDIGNDTLDVWSTKSTIPSYIPRKSRNEISKILASSTGVTSKINKKPLRNASAPPRKTVLDRTNTIVIPKLETNRGEQAVSSPEDDPSDDESDSDASEEETMQAPLPAVRPSKAIDAVRYDTVKTLWRVPYRSATADDIRRGLAEFWDIVRTIRDRWKSDAQAVKTAEEAKKVGELPLLNERVANQREMLEVALTAAVNEGHKDIVEHLAENLQLVLALAQFLRDRTASGDYSGTLSKAILELLSRCKTLTDGVLEKTNISKYLPRYLKRGDDSVKALAKRISDNGTTAARKRKELITKTSGTIAVQPKEPKVIPINSQKAVSPTAGVKRVRPSETTNEPPTKRVASEQPVITTGTAGVQIKATAAIKRSSSSSDTKPQTTTAVPIVTKKATQVTAKPSSFFANTFAGLQSAKKPSASASTKPAASAKLATSNAKPTTTSTPSKVATVTPRPLFSIADTLASVSRTKEVEPTPKPEESAPLESAEEKIKRIRKEQRRKLRVSFKPDDVLVSYRMLTPPLDDEQGSNVYDVRDAGDIDSEGRMFKLHHDDKMDIDDEDEISTGTMDDMTRTFGPLSSIDFSIIPEEDRQKMYVPYGGGVMRPECPEAEAQERREANTLIAVYVHASDIPATPKEPPDIAEDAVIPTEFGKPPDIVLQRLEALKNAQRPAVPITPLVSADLAALLSAMPQNMPQPSQPLPKQQQSATTDLEKIFAQFSQTALPSQITQQASAPNPQSMFTLSPQPHQPAQFANLGGIFSIPSATTQVQQAPNFQQPAPVPGLSENLSAMLASLQQQPSGPLAGLTAAGMPDFSQYGQQQQSYAQPGYPTNQQPQQSQQLQYPFENPERRRWIESGGADNNNSNDQSGDAWQQQKQWGGGNKGGRKGGEPSRQPPKFVVQCKYWKEGKCRKGADCTYLHTG